MLSIEEMKIKKAEEQNSSTKLIKNNVKNFNRAGRFL